jgi:hypothetical protein
LRKAPDQALWGHGRIMSGDRCRANPATGVGRWRWADAPRSYDGPREWLANQDIEGVVWHRKDGRMVSVRDFGLIRRPHVLLATC